MCRIAHSLFVLFSFSAGACGWVETVSERLSVGDPDSAVGTDQTANTNPIADATDPSGNVVGDRPLTPGPVFFAVRNRHRPDIAGIVRLQDGKFERVIRGTVDDDTNFVRGSDGHAYVSVFSRIYALDGPNAFKPIATGFRTESFNVGLTGELWALKTQKFGQYLDGGWAFQPDSTVGPNLGSLRDIAQDRSGRLWMLCRKGLTVLDDGVWEVFDIEKHDELVLGLLDIDLARDGSMLVMTPYAVYRIKSPTEVSTLRIADADHHGNLAVQEMSGDDLLVTLKHALARVQPDGAITWYEPDTDFYGGHIRNSDVDGQDRIWLTSYAGVSVIGPGASRTSWPFGAVPELFGRPRGILVLGDGPTTLPTVGPAARGSLTGIAHYNDEPVRNSPVRICGYCDGTSTRGVFFDGMTDDSGRFRFDDVPLNKYNILVKSETKWREDTRYFIRPFLDEGKLHDTGIVVVR